MPNTKRLLARRGTRFTDYIASTAQCCPSRASLITGQYAHNHGVTSNTVGYPGLVDKGNVLPVWLQRAGYRTIHVGKFLNGYERSAEPDSTVRPRLGPVAQRPRATALLRLRPVRQRHRPAPRGRRETTSRTCSTETRCAWSEGTRPGAPLLPPARPAGATRRDSSSDPTAAAAGRPSPSRPTRKLFRDARLPSPPSFNEANMSDKPSFLSGRAEGRSRARDGRFASTGAAPSPRCAASIAASGRSIDAVEGRRRAEEDRVHLHLRQRPVPRPASPPKRQGPSLRGGAARAAGDQGAEALPGRRHTGEEGRPAGWKHRPRPDDPRPRRRPAMFGSGALPHDGRTLADAAAEALRQLAAQSRVADRVQGAGRRAATRPASSPGSGRATTIYVQHSRVVDPGTSQCVSGRPARALQPEAGSVRAPQPVLRRKQPATVRSATSSSTSRPG